MGFVLDTRLGTFEDVAAKVPAHRPLLEAIRALVARHAPGAVESASAREGSVWWGMGGNKMKDGFAWAMPHKAHVNFGFMQGAHLPDPQGRLDGTGKSLRHVKLRTPAEVEDPALAALLDAAVAERRAAAEGAPGHDTKG
ncbi:DUF1801 domain-containing protein [Histidinibacterium lentulum]|uniref:DUF1801 domain-containing protein n=1 Tax=Histidinibacterium lentulum TaxID=2480588 RepID=A0A3N2QUX3_9RHOB|nr:DUF1801 domain-containing protein [Histidinibacterium lentulum]ROT98982.1 DUF1801 domain-containing protein [Histidinibacterium lentulum]